MMCFVPPIVFVSVVQGVCSFQGRRSTGRILGHTLALYLITMASFAALGILIARYVIRPGAGMELDLPAGLAGPQVSKEHRAGRG